MTWTYHITEIDGRQAQVLIDDRFQEPHVPSELSRVAWFRVHAQRDPGAGFWRLDETESLEAIERDLIELCQLLGKGWAVYVLRIDTRGIREYFIYFGDGAELSSVLPKLEAAHPGYKIEYEETADPSWERYLSLLKRVSPQ
jgi:hypothetical protein